MNFATELKTGGEQGAAGCRTYLPSQSGSAHRGIPTFILLPLLPVPCPKAERSPGAKVIKLLKSVGKRGYFLETTDVCPGKP